MRMLVVEMEVGDNQPPQLGGSVARVESGQAKSFPARSREFEHGFSLSSSFPESWKFIMTESPPPVLAFADLVGRPEPAKRIDFDSLVIDQTLCELPHMPDVMFAVLP